MDRPYFIRILDKKKIRKEFVTGEEISEHFVARDEDDRGWVITHLPTGQTLVRCGFAQFSDAKEFALGVEKVYGKVLDSKSDISARTPDQRKMSLFLRRLSEEYADQVITMDDVRSLAKTL